MNQDQGRLVAAVALSALVLFGWQMFFAPKQDITKLNQIEKIEKTQDQENQVAKVKKAQATPVLPPSKSTVAEDKTYTIKGESSVYQVANNLNILDAKGSLVKSDFDKVAGVKNPLEINLIGEGQAVKLNFNISYNEQNKLYLGVDKRFGVNLVLRVLENEKLYFSLNSATPYLYQIKLLGKAESKGQKVRQFLVFNNDIERIDVGDKEEIDATMKWAGLDYDYHIMALVLAEKQASRQRAYEDGTFKINFSNPISKLEGYFTFQQKNYDNLVKSGDNLQASVDFGIFAIISVPILRGLQFFYKYIPNYGIAIILLTLIIRLLLLPLNYKSFKSMKKMQDIQPEITKLKEKYKDDPQRMQKETMALFKKAGANPLGGCLPLLLQMPVFFAFYRVLFSAVELVGAPFFGWIQDLSAKDPYYVLPVLMTVTMLLQQKFMPSATTDAAQRKIMLIMPLVFGVIMKDLPAGLALYIFVSTFVGIVQQFVINRSKT